MSIGDDAPSSPPNGGMSWKWVVQKLDEDLMDCGDTLAKVVKDIASNLRYQRVVIVCDAKAPPPTTLAVDSSSSQPSTSSSPNMLQEIQPLRIRKKSNVKRSPNFPPVASFYDHISSLEQLVCKTAKSSIGDSMILEELERQVQEDSDRLARFVASSKYDTPSGLRSLFKALSQRLTSKVVTAALLDQGVEAEHVVLEGDCVLEHNRHELKTVHGKHVSKLLPRIHSRVLVVSLGPDSRISLDYLASFLAISLNAKELQVWTKLKGIYTADPKKVPSARLVPFVSPPEAAELSKQGQGFPAKPLLDQLVAHGIPVRMRSLIQPQNFGTVIDPALRFPDLDVRTSTTGFGLVPPTAITIKDGILMLSIKSPLATRSSPTFLSGVCGVLSRFGVVVNLINTSERHASVAIEAGLPRTLLDRVVGSLRTHGKVSVYHDMAILTIVGRELYSTSGIAGRVFSTLSKALVNVEMIGRVSDVSVGCVVDGVDTTRAVWLAHRCCFASGKTGVERGNARPGLY